MFSDLQKRIVLFLVGCMGSRVGLVYLARTYAQNTRFMELMGALALIPAVGFFYIYLTGARKTGAEVFGAPIWWNGLRPFHGFMYALFAVMALFHIQGAWLVLLVDVIVGFTAFTAHHAHLTKYIPVIQ